MINPYNMYSIYNTVYKAYTIYIINTNYDPDEISGWDGHIPKQGPDLRILCAGQDDIQKEEQ